MERRWAHGLLRHLPRRAEVRLEVAGATVDADDAERHVRVVDREGERDRRAPAVADHHDGIGVDRREEPVKIPADGLEVVPGVGAIAPAVAGEVDGDHTMRRGEAGGDEIPPARVAGEPVQGEDRGLAAGVIAHREREARGIDAELGDGYGHCARDCR